MQAGLGEFVGRIRALTKSPIAVGFGISQPDHVHALRGIADGAVVGSRLIDAIRNGEDLAAVVRELKEATK
jgi:tryptophan synthase alpha chain